MEPTPQPSVLITPEAVPLSVEIADAGSRGGAILLDSLLQFAILMFVLPMTDGLDGMQAAALVVTVWFLCFFVYFALFEGLWNGQTPGKRATKLRVVTAEGQPIGMRESVVRNLIRSVDYLPTFYLVGLVSILVSKRRQRLGDFAAGTIVVQERVTTPPVPLVLPERQYGLPSLDAAGIGPSEYELVRAFLLRRYTLPEPARSALADKIAHTIRPRMGGGGTYPGMSEAFLEEVARAYHQRAEGRPGG